MIDPQDQFLRLIIMIDPDPEVFDIPSRNFEYCRYQISENFANLKESLKFPKLAQKSKLILLLFCQMMIRYSPRTIEKMKIMGALLELPAKQHCQSGPFTLELGQIGYIGSAI